MSSNTVKPHSSYSMNDVNGNAAINLNLSSKISEQETKIQELEEENKNLKHDIEILRNMVK